MKKNIGNIRSLKSWALYHCRYKGRAKKNLHSLLLAVLMIWTTVWWFTLNTQLVSNLSLHLYKLNNSLQDHVSKIEVMMEPASPCGGPVKVPILILVASDPLRAAHRRAIRDTWAKYQPTYFVMGLYQDYEESQLIDTYREAEIYNDLIIFDAIDHYYNLTLKTALMMKWTLDQCPQAQFVFKTDDDVMVNPWILRKVLQDNENANLIGYSINTTSLMRNQINNWYLPHWLLRKVSYLSGSGYLISGEYLEKILQKAYQVPMINLEDVYFTHVVSQRELSLRVTHERRLSPYKPWLKVPCVYWDLASVHSLGPREMVTAWTSLRSLIGSNNTEQKCLIYQSVIKEYSGMLGPDWS